jgi:Rrf2 family nitric oxide-sensitive transcriptional repressor
MRLTRFTDNALRCLLYLASEPERVATVHEIAKATGMSPDHLLKVIKRMLELGYVRTIRGRNGGVHLATAPSAIRVADVVRATEDNLALVPCFRVNGNNCPLGPSCALPGCLQEALGAFFAVLARYSIADVVKRESREDAA